MIYLDHAATTYPHEAVVEAMDPSFDTYYRNPSASYATEEADAVDDARRSVADLLGADPETVVFTGGGSEADNLALKGALDGSDGDHVVTTTIEHDAILETCEWLEARGGSVTRVSPGPDGQVDPTDVEDAIRSDTAIVSIMHANNETGVIQPLDAIGEITADHDVLFHSDTVQSAGKIPIDVDDLGLDLASLSAHKFYGPKGVGALYVRDGVELEPLIHGGGQERGRRSGTENVPGIVGMGAAADLAIGDLERQRARLTALREDLVETIRDETDGSLLGHSSHRLPGYAMVGFPGASGADLVRAFADRDVAVSSGSACHAGESAPSRVLLEMGVDSDLASGAVRLSLGRRTTDEDVRYVGTHLDEILAAATV
ncbi:MAG: cysteine desulfurase family protein [Halodesulfurarchaeum sp.]